MEKFKKYKSYLIVTIIVILIISVFIVKQICGEVPHECDDPTHNHGCIKCNLLMCKGGYSDGAVK